MSTRESGYIISAISLAKTVLAQRSTSSAERPAWPRAPRFISSVTSCPRRSTFTLSAMVRISSLVEIWRFLSR
jgi:hypothetical protein